MLDLNKMDFKGSERNIIKFKEHYRIFNAYYEFHHRSIEVFLCKKVKNRIHSETNSQQIISK